jgi:hypothetical protein
MSTFADEACSSTLTAKKNVGSLRERHGPFFSARLSAA